MLSMTKERQVLSQCTSLLLPSLRSIFENLSSLLYCVQVVYCQDGVFVHTAVPITTQTANIIPGRVSVIEKVSLLHLGFYRKHETGYPLRKVKCRSVARTTTVAFQFQYMKFM